MKTNILTVNIDNINYEKTLEKIQEFINDDKQHYIVTPNPEIILKAAKDLKYRMILNNADLSLPDGFGIILASIFLGNPIYTRVTGSDLSNRLFKLANDKQYKIFLLGGMGDSAQTAKTKLELKYKDIKVVGATSGFENIKDIKAEENESIINSINNSGAQILFVGYGAPFQEQWIFDNLSKMQNVKVALGIGGVIDFASGYATRAPKIFRCIGMEWFWRLITEPYRIDRIFNAVVIFSWNVLKWKIHLLKPFRKNIVAVIINDNNEILAIKEKFDKFGYRFPQGGVEKNEDQKQALLREVYEETGFSKLKILGTANKVISYYWPMEWKDIPKDKKTYNKQFCGQKQTVYFLKMTENEKFNPQEEEIEDHKWLKKEELENIIMPIKKQLIEVILDEIDKYLK
ncbi:MAG TPA: WecB/TagA/CpsF family glycosyltransferase [bacterium]|jgi:N-acetylglucosaminyldiphosphoundecaprenol N-acetyl-beta-D-mannosaminyltransferase|nr:WecB/TagA/CpsF family glycosyltransferase [bacterium]HOG37910.1 WecB/TagA/CpsF family glycosyltransferase [bacterium]HQI02968.1 WecB/TagA/CpsF family glycosyltransferase [bacterium]